MVKLVLVLEHLGGPLSFTLRQYIPITIECQGVFRVFLQTVKTESCIRMQSLESKRPYVQTFLVTAGISADDMDTGGLCDELARLEGRGYPHGRAFVPRGLLLSYARHTKFLKNSAFGCPRWCLAAAPGLLLSA